MAHHPVDESASDLADQLLRLTKRINHAHRQNLAPLGVTPAQGRMLRTVAHSARPPRMADLAEHLGVVPRQVTSLVDALEERGLVRRAPDAANRRVTRIELTDGGVQALTELRRARRSATEELLAPLTPGQRDELSRLLALLDGHHPYHHGPGPTRHSGNGARTDTGSGTGADSGVGS
ncbi:MarR family winged helix-turn-helix transcriptional regulator [Streptomyces albus]|uniref:MarR family winged helix-turn-helix transcriptional regulator n=1 Tax=Streptomyces albus TaxID=1888 RepID=UPI0006E12E26|nr:MarR family transcriptional regulator [Streptomyces albus]